MNKPVELVSHFSAPRSEMKGPLYRLGDWYWVGVDREDGEVWLGAITHVGSNYIEISGPADERCTHHTRVHFRDVEKECRREPEAEKVIAAKIEEQRHIVAEATKRISAITGRLAIDAAHADGETRSLAVYDRTSMDEYKRDLITARDKSLPALFEEIKKASALMSVWMSAQMIPMRAEAEQAEGVIEVVKGRIHGVELYAGLAEEVEEIRDGAPAAMDEPIHLFQRRHYMDEECLIDYEVGGMRFESVLGFDAWLLKPANLARILPCPRSVVAFRVRRNKAEVEFTSFRDFINMLFEQGKDKDMLTYLYMRNGERVYRLSTTLDFGERLFPEIDRSTVMGGKLYAVKGYDDEIERLATEGEYQDLKRRAREERAMLKGLPEEERRQKDQHLTESLRYWVLWDHETVWYDDIAAYMKKQLDDHNRVVLVLQGLLDRSRVFEPHPTYKLWEGADFNRAFKLVYDDSRALAAGEKPDFLAYQAEVNAKLKKGSTTVGQVDFWMEIEAERENKRRQEREGSRYWDRPELKRYRPYGNPGPGVYATVQEYSSAKGCTFTWRRERLTYRPRMPWDAERSDDVGCRLTVPVDRLLCVGGYRPGDYHKFYDDPRTRAEYLKWAPLLLRAEEYHAGVNRDKEE